MVYFKSALALSRQHCASPAARSPRPRRLMSCYALEQTMATMMTRNRLYASLKRQGVMLESGHGPVPCLVEAIAGEPVRGNWWSHPQSHRIFELTRSLRDSPDVLTCRLVNGKVTFVHRRVWPALVRLANRFPKQRLAAIQELHMRTGAHKVITTPFPKWVPNDVKTAAGRLSAEQALLNLGSWACLT